MGVDFTLHGRHILDQETESWRPESVGEKPIDAE